MATPGQLERAFMSGLSEHRRLGLTATGLDAAITALVARAVRSRAFELDAAAFVAHVARVLPTDVAAPADLAALHAEDLYLAYGCAVGHPEALAAFERDHGPAIDRVARKIAGPGAAAEDAGQLARAALLVASRERPPRIGGYRGRGPLGAYVRVTATRAAFGTSRAERRPLPEDLARAVSDAAPVDADPELQYLRATYSAEAGAAIAEAIANLDDRDRALLHASIVERQSIDKLAATYRVHRATAARQLAHARTNLVAGTRRALAARVGLSESDLDSLMRLVNTDLDVSVGRLLAPTR